MLALIAVGALSLQEPRESAPAAGAREAGVVQELEPITSAESADGMFRLDQARSLLERAEAAGDLAEARALVGEALKIVDRAPAIQLDADATDLVPELGLAWNAQAIPLAAAAFARVLPARERTHPKTTRSSAFGCRVGRPGPCWSETGREEIAIS